MSILDRILWAQIKAKAQTFVFSIGFIAILAGWCLIHFDNDYKPVQMEKPKLYVKIRGTTDGTYDDQSFEGYCTNVKIVGGDYIFTMEDGTKVYTTFGRIDEPNDLMTVSDFETKCEEYYKK